MIVCGVVVWLLFYLWLFLLWRVYANWKRDQKRFAQYTYTINDEDEISSDIVLEEEVQTMINQRKLR